MTSPFWGNCTGLFDGLGFCEQRQREAGTKPFPDASWWLAGGGQDPDDEREVWFSVFPSQGTCEGRASDAVLEDFIHEEAVFWDVIEASKQHDTPRSDGKVRHLIPSAS